MTEVMESTGEPWELVIVNDGSSDGSADILRELFEEDPEHLRIVNFARNFGHGIAVTAGMDYTQGQAVVLIDADLQDPPEVILDLIAKWREGYDVVYAVRAERVGDTWFKKQTAALFYRLIARLTDVDIPVDTGDFRLMDRRVVEALKRMPEHHRFVRGMVSWVGFRQTGVEYVRQERFAGETKYPLRKMIRFAWDGITGFSYVPLQMATFLGFIFAGLSLLAIPIVAYMRLFLEQQPLLGQATTLIVLLLVSGVQLISVGIIGEYLGRVYNEVRGRPLYIVQEVLGFEDDAAQAASPPVVRSASTDQR
jgi:dolichol-phosphate mannosyltransferase